MMVNPVQISFWQPVDRERSSTRSPRHLAMLAFDQLIDPLFTSPLATTALRLTEYNGAPWHFSVGRVVRVDLYPQVLRIVAVVTGLFLWQRTTTVILAAALTLKYLVRSSEIYYRAPSQTEGASPLVLDQEEGNRKLWAQKWWCDTMFYLFAIGFDETSIIPRETQRSEEDPTIQVKIGDVLADYPASFLNKLPFFQALLASGMREVDGPSVSLSKDFPFSHDELKALKARLEDPNALSYDELSDVDFLCIGMRGEEVPFVQELGKMQKMIHEQNYGSLRSYAADHPPGVKVCSYSLNFFSETSPLEFEEKSDKEAVVYAKGCLEEAVRVDSSIHRYYQVNQVMNELILHLYWNHTSERDFDLLSAVLRIIDEFPECANYVTVLDVPRPSKELPTLFRKLPNLKWLSVESFHLREGFPERHESLRVLKVSHRIEEIGQVQQRFPNLDVIEVG